MSTVAICPNCATPVKFQFLPVDKCPSCGSNLPEQLRSVVEASVRREQLQKPALLLLGMFGSALFSGVAAIFLVLAPFDIGSYTINDEPVTGPEFLRRAGFLFFGGAAICAAISYGLARNRSWTRPLMLVYWIVIAIGSISLGDSGNVACSILAALFALALAALYLYAKDSVTDYYDAIRKRESQQTSAVAPAG